MPELCRFFGISIRINFGDHLPPHFHAVYGGSDAMVEIDSLAIHGRFPVRAQRLVLEWASLHREELRAAWDRATLLEDPGKIDPLQ